MQEWSSLLLLARKQFGQKLTLKRVIFGTGRLKLREKAAKNYDEIKQQNVQKFYAD